MKGTELQDTGDSQEEGTVLGAKDRPHGWVHQAIPSSIRLSHRLRAAVLLAVG